MNSQVDRAGRGREGESVRDRTKRGAQAHDRVVPTCSQALCLQTPGGPGQSQNQPPGVGTGRGCGPGTLPGRGLQDHRAGTPSLCNGQTFPDARISSDSSILLEK